MSADNLVHMANRIGEFFQSMPDRAEAEREIAVHLKKFWAPAMRQALLAQVDAHQAAGLLPIVGEALSVHRGLLA